MTITITEYSMQPNNPEGNQVFTLECSGDFNLLNPMLFSLIRSKKKQDYIFKVSSKFSTDWHFNLSKDDFQLAQKIIPNFNI